MHVLQNNLNTVQGKIAQLELEAAQRNLVEKTLLNRILQLESENYWYKSKFSDQSLSTQPAQPETSS